MTWLLIAASFTGLALTLNAWRPIYAPASVALVSFFAGWLTTELAIQHFAWQALVAFFLVREGAVATWPGQAALAAVLLSCAGLVALHLRGRRTEASVEAALTEGLGADFESALPPATRAWLGATLPWHKILFPFPVRQANVETTRNVVFERHGKVSLRLDVHRNRARPTGCPTLLYVHGGGWVIGQRRYQGLPLMKHLAARGWVCISVDYRLSPRATFPEHIIDVKRAIAWARANAASYGGNPDFLVLCGNSAGAHLAALAALTPNEPAFQPGFEEVDTRVDGCISLYGIYDFKDRHGHFRNDGLKYLLAKHVMKVTRAEAPELYTAASPVDRIHRDAPPFLIVHGDRDTLAPTNESRRFSAALRGVSSAPVVYVEVPDAQHAFEIFPSPRTAHFLTAATGFTAYVYGRWLEAHAPGTAREEVGRAPRESAAPDVAPFASSPAA
jgi:acetyl esterase/lipase